MRRTVSSHLSTNPKTPTPFLSSTHISHERERKNFDREPIVHNKDYLYYKQKET